MAARDVATIAGKQAGRSAVANRDHSKSVVLYLEKPIVAVKRFGHQLDDLKRELGRREHVDSCSFITPRVDVVSANRGGRISRSRACVRAQSRPRHGDRTARFDEPADPRYRHRDYLPNTCVTSSVSRYSVISRIFPFVTRNTWQ